MKKKFTIDIYLNDTQISLLQKYDFEKGTSYLELSCDEDKETLLEIDGMEIVRYSSVCHKYIFTLHGRKIFEQLNK